MHFPLLATPQLHIIERAKATDFRPRSTTYIHATWSVWFRRHVTSAVAQGSVISRRSRLI